MNLERRKEMKRCYALVTVNRLKSTWLMLRTVAWYMPLVPSCPALTVLKHSRMQRIEKNQIRGLAGIKPNRTVRSATALLSLKKRLQKQPLLFEKTSMIKYHVVAMLRFK